MGHRKVIKLTRLELMSFLDYNPNTGEFIWIKSPATRIPVGKLAGHKHHNGYLGIELRGITYQAHRLAWLFNSGEWPPEELDHINGTRCDNRIINLRPVNRSQNQHNRKHWKKGTSSKYKGVSYHKLTGKWTASISFLKKREHLGLFNTEEEAAKARNYRAKILHGEYARAG